MKKRKSKSIWCYLDDKKHCDVIQWALAANVSKDEAKRQLTEMYSNIHDVTFKIQ